MKKMCLTLHIHVYTYRFSFYFQNYSVLWNTIVTFMKVVLNSIFIPSSEGVPPPPRKTLRKLHQNGVFWAHFEVLINLNGHFYNWKFIRKNMFLAIYRLHVPMYFDFFFSKILIYSCIWIFFFHLGTVHLIFWGGGGGVGYFGKKIPCSDFDWKK